MFAHADVTKIIAEVKKSRVIQNITAPNSTTIENRATR